MSEGKKLSLLAESGKKRIEWAAKEMSVLAMLNRDLCIDKPFEGTSIGVCLHITKETAVLVKALHDGGANVALCGSNPLSTQDDVVCALRSYGITVYGKRGQNEKEYYANLGRVLDKHPKILIDDGADLIVAAHKAPRAILKNILGAQEETTTGVKRIQRIVEDKALAFPVVAINNALTKCLFDNVYGTGQSTIDAILRTTNILLAGKWVVVCGYGNCGKGVAIRAKGMGAQVLVTEIDEVRALQAAMDGFRVLPISDASRVGDIFITATGNCEVITDADILKMKDGAILANVGHFNVEISLPGLESLAVSKIKISDSLEEFALRDGRRIYLIAEGRLANLVAAEGHPSSVMDMSFANQVLVAKRLASRRHKLEAKIYEVPREIDVEVARLKLRSMGITIDKLTLRQKTYLEDWSEGT